MKYHQGLIGFYSLQTKEAVANLTADINLANAQAALVKAINGTLMAVQAAGTKLTNAILDAKLSLTSVSSELFCFCLPHTASNYIRVAKFFEGRAQR